MYRENKQFYSLPPLTFVGIGLVLLIGVIIFHDFINHRSDLAAGDRYGASQSTPQEVLGEIVSSNKNLSSRTVEFQQAGRSIKLLYQSSPDFFITQN